MAAVSGWKTRRLNAVEPFDATLTTRIVYEGAKPVAVTIAVTSNEDARQCVVRLTLDEVSRLADVVVDTLSRLDA